MLCERGIAFRLTVHAPQLHLSVVCAARHDRDGVVERHPVDAAVVSFQHVLDDGVRLTEQLRAARSLQVVLQRRRTGGHVLLAQSCQNE